MKSQERFIRRRLGIVTGILVLCFTMIGVRAVDLQLVRSDKLKLLAEKQRQRQLEVQAPRGQIVDATGRILAESIEVPSIYAIGSEVKTDRLPEVARILHVRTSELRRRLRNKTGFVWLARQVSPAQAEKIMALNIPGIRQEIEWRRFNPLGPETGHVLGFVGVDGHGLEGLERSLDAKLQGRSGHKQILRDARGNLLPGDIWLNTPVRGQTVQLHLDAYIQSLAYAALADGVRKQRAKGGTVIVMRPSDGAILAMANWPGFNPNNFGDFNPSQWRNRAITDVFEPGSVLKPFTVAAALESGHWRPDSRLYCEKGNFRVANRVIHDVHPQSWLDVTGVLVHSSNICATKLALDVGPEKLGNVLAAVGFGQKSGIELPGESAGILPPVSRWGPVETATISFGQGVAVTALQLATAYSVLANGGLLVKPRLVKDGHTNPPKRVLPRQVARDITRMLRQATTPEGTGSLAVPVGYPVAGKTGTAQKPSKHGGYAKGKFIAVFSGFVPADNPQLVITVVVDEPRGSIYGGQVAAPIFRSLAATVLPYLGITPDTEPVPDSMEPYMAVSHRTGTTATGGNLPPLYGKSLREIKRLASKRGYRLRVHGSGWAVRQKPSAFSELKPGDLLEVWLDG
jgi:cell division protein FtsI (penicillin-binding protein 3)